MILKVIKMDLTPEQKEKNYEFLINSLHRLRAGIPATEDIEQADWCYFKGMRQVIGDFSAIHPEITDRAYRAKTNEMEQLARYLDIFTEESGHIHYGAYLQLLERIEYVVEYRIPDEMDGLMSAFKKQAIV